MILTGGNRSTRLEVGETYCHVVDHKSTMGWPGIERKERLVTLSMLVRNWFHFSITSLSVVFTQNYSRFVLLPQTYKGRDKHIVKCAP